MKPGDHHTSVIVWLMNKDGEFLISRRAQGKRAAGMWEVTGGCTVSGETQLDAALREAKEELGLSLNPEAGEIFTNFTSPHSGKDGWAYITVWIFRQDFSLGDIVFQPEETDAARWASADEIREMISAGTFIEYDYIPDLLDYLKN